MPTTTAQPFQSLVHRRSGNDFLKRILGHREVLFEDEQLENLACVDRIGLGGTREDLLELGELHVVDVVQPVASSLNQAIERTGVPIEAFHRDCDGKGQLVTVSLDAAEELLEADIVVRDVELLEDRAIRTSDTDAMGLAANVDADT